MTRSILYPALRTAIFQHSPLSVTIISDGSSEARFARLRSVDLREVVSWECETSSESVADDLVKLSHASPLETSGRLPAWRVIVSGGVLCISLHHAIGDGESGLAIHASILSALNDSASDDGDSDPVIYMQIPEMLPPLEGLLDLPVSWTAFLKGCYRYLFPPAVRGVWSGRNITSGFPLKSNHRTMLFSSKSLHSLREKCRLEKTTITAFLHAAIAEALFGVLNEMAAKELVGSISISLRRFMDDVGRDEMGVFAASVNHHHYRRRNDRQDFWDAARDVKATISKRIDSRLDDWGVAMIKYAPKDLSTLLKILVGKRRDLAFDLSNLGVFDGQIAEDSAWKIQKMVFSQSADVVGAALDFTAVGVKDGELALVCTWQEGIVDDVVVEAVIHGVRKSISAVY